MIVFRIVGATLLAYVVSLGFGLGNVGWFALFSPSGGLMTTLIFYFILSIVFPVSYGLVGLLSKPFSKLVKGKWYVAILPILIYVWHCIADIGTLFGAAKTGGFNISTFYYIRAIGMAIYYIALYFWLSFTLFVKAE